MSSKKQLQMVNYLRKQNRVWSMWFLLPTGSCGSSRSVKAAPAYSKVGAGEKMLCLPKWTCTSQSQGAVLTETSQEQIRDDVLTLTQFELLEADSGESFLS